MIYEDVLVRRGAPDSVENLKHDLSIIRQDVVAVLQETASVRASMTEFSSWRPGASRRFIVTAGFLCFILTAALVIYQGQLQVWIQRIAQ